MGILLVEFAKLGVAEEDFEVDEIVCLYALTSLDEVPLENFVSRTSSRGAQKERIKMMGEAMSFFCSRLNGLERVGLSSPSEAERPGSVFQ